jgi:hypothetical protein
MRCSIDSLSRWTSKHESLAGLILWLTRVAASVSERTTLRSNQATNSRDTKSIHSLTLAARTGDRSVMSRTEYMFRQGLYFTCPPALRDKYSSGKLDDPAIAGGSIYDQLTQHKRAFLL